MQKLNLAHDAIARQVHQQEQMEHQSQGPPQFSLFYCDVFPTESLKIQRLVIIFITIGM
jgi:hypothetical protein